MHRAVFYRQMATMLEAGIPIRATLVALAEQAGGGLGLAAASLARTIEAGGSLADALRAASGRFSPLEVELLSAGETSGRIDRSARLLAEAFEYRKQMVGRLATRLAYPVFVLHVAIVLLAIPQAVTGGLGPFLKLVGGGIGALWGGALGLFLAGTLLSRSPAAAAAAERLLLCVPVIGSIRRKIVLSRFARSLAALYAAGVPMSRAADVATRAAASPYLSRTLGPRLARLASGEPLSELLAETGVLPAVWISMIATGETTGKLDQMLDKAAELSEDEARNALDILATLAPVVFFLVIACAIGYAVIRFWTGYFRSIQGLLP